VLRIPGDLTAKPLEPPDAPPRHPEGHGLNGLACQRPPWAHHLIKEMGARLTSGNTGVQEALELLEFVDEPGHIPGGEITGGNRKRVVGRPTRWSQTWPPDTVHGIQEERLAWLRSGQI
jgi:hypothetical protein